MKQHFIIPLLVEIYGQLKKSGVLVRQRTIPTERRPLVGEVVPTLAERGCRVVSATNTQGR
jgi:hypothetical protein